MPSTGFKEKAKEGGMLYTAADVPPPLLGLILGWQHYLTMLGATALIPLIIVPVMGGSPADTAEVICSIFFVSGLCTLIQTTFGDRLPIVQGGSFAFLGSTFSTIFLVMGDGIDDDHERFLVTMRTIQGSVLVCGIVQVVLGYSGLFPIILKFISPITIAPTASAVAFSLYGVPGGSMYQCEWLTFVVVICMIIFSQLLGKVKINVKGAEIAIFTLFPVIWSVFASWIIAAIVQGAGGMEPVSDMDPGFSKCKTNTFVFEASPAFKFPYPGQWGAPIFRGASIAAMMGAMLVSMTESIGDYYAVAQIVGAPPPSGAVISRGLAGEGWGLIICGLIGSSNGTTSYSENVGALALTKVGSRAVVQTGALFMMFVGLFPKFGAIFVSMPAPMVAGLYMTLFGFIASVGIAQLQHVDLNSSRNLFIIGFCLYNSLAIGGPGGYFNTATGGVNPFGPDADGAKAFFSNPMIISLICGLILDNIIPGTKEERGLLAYAASVSTESTTNEEFQEVYAQPYYIAKLFKNCVYLDFIELGKWPTKPEGGYKSSKGDCCEMFCGKCLYPPVDTTVTKSDSKTEILETAAA